jgi:hypothetical protein
MTLVEAADQVQRTVAIPAKPALSWLERRMPGPALSFEKEYS